MDQPLAIIAPAKDFHLETWKLTLPVDKQGGFTGRAREIAPIDEGYEYHPYFYNARDGALVFMAPVEGATTSGSYYPRSELREMETEPKYTEAAWTLDDGGFLSATLSVDEVPVTKSGLPGRVVIGQIHGPDDELCRLYYDNGELYFYDDKSGPRRIELKYVLRSEGGEVSSIPLKAKFKYTIRATSDHLTVTATYNGTRYVAREGISSFWPGKRLYFKAGMYVQVGKPGSGAGTVGSGRGRASFFHLSLPSHPNANGQITARGHVR